MLQDTKALRSSNEPRESFFTYFPLLCLSIHGQKHSAENIVSYGVRNVRCIYITIDITLKFEGYLSSVV